MTLDLARVSPQVRRMGQQLRDRLALQAARREHARQTLDAWASRWEELRELAERRERAQRLASPCEPLDARHGPLDAPGSYRVIATDGSQIEPDRHGLAEYFLINVGWAVIRYGAAPAAELSSEPRLSFEPTELFIRDQAGRPRVPIQGGHLADLRAVRELEKAAELAVAAGELPAGRLPTVVLQDGTLLLWVLEDRPEDLLRQTFLEPDVTEMRRCEQTGQPLASYISRPRAPEVANLLRAATCRGEVAGCAACARRGDESCALEGQPDRLLFMDLEAGQRSALFAVTLQGRLEAYYRGQRVHFFYLNVGSEIARVEVPEWVARDQRALELVQAALVDQCERGQGYPVALTRSHEQALVRAADRASVRTLIASMFARQGLTTAFSEKEAAKRIRAV